MRMPRAAKISIGIALGVLAVISLYLLLSAGSSAIADAGTHYSAHARAALD
jgi:hypothetical protein